jgi:3-oxoacyl-ACP reductase-like protein
MVCVEWQQQRRRTWHWELSNHMRQHTLLLLLLQVHPQLTRRQTLTKHTEAVESLAPTHAAAAAAAVAAAVAAAAASAAAAG